ncbi:ubiquinone biosynthesis accessory factor UbiJ [Aeromonas simiae]|uniref:ubiquinone biosynthesis accessory factor UbiJ n=1 Tax=Aeromonas simiae TaxID=218936 RepID=UPI00266DBDBE|nr:SCP2 sterol-binding domain-containing protein [Aeromonas simiae]MDO2949772.1 SCP2 sterol-binding domain-containing protein [Aeromonas simiae]MDO2953555.1 SCP2 sterol-binding domain-containing protein [Aeromonas simiae]MDO2957080.1 SCP2 sterol-binding domain-containing protein [Aeromonas simiae]
MPMDALITAAVETACNQLLARDASAAERQKKLIGKTLRLDVHELKPLWFIFSSGRVDVLARYEGEADAGLSLSLSALGLLRDPSALTRYIREERLDIEGDPQLVQAFGSLFGELAIDWEEQLSRYTGDVLAHTLFAGARKARSLLGLELRRSRTQLAEYLTEELRLAPGPLEVASFGDDVEALASRLKATELRLARLEAKVA